MGREVRAKKRALFFYELGMVSLIGVLIVAFLALQILIQRG
jgi:hypothetical protein